MDIPQNRDKMRMSVAQWNAMTARGGASSPFPQGFWQARIPTDITPEYARVEKGKTAYAEDTTGIYNYAYSNDLAIQVLYDEKGYAVQPKYPYMQSAHTLVEALDTTASALALGGSIQTAGVETFSRDAYTVPGLDTATFDVELHMELLADKDQLVPPEALVQKGMLKFRNEITKALYKDHDTVTTIGIDSVDRMITDYTLSYTNHSYAAGDCDFMGVDRSDDTWFGCNYSDNSAVDRVFQLEYLEGVIQDCEDYADGPNGANALMILTGTDTKWRINNAAGPQIWNPREEFSLTVGGISTDTGTRYNIRTPSLHGIPIIAFPEGTHITQDAISRIYVENQDYNGIKILAAPAVTDSADPVVTGAFLHRYVAWTMHSLFSLKSYSNGTVWDIA